MKRERTVKIKDHSLENGPVFYLRNAEGGIVRKDFPFGSRT
jgi:hypothetical protein